MKRIDLHIHTYNEKGQANGPRYINNVDLISTLKRNSVYFASVTEHNVFDEEKFYELSQDKDIVFIPGIELNVKYNNKIYHFIINSQDLNFIKSLVMSNEDDFIEYSDLKTKLLNSKNRIIVAPHFLKDPNRSFLDRKEYLLILDEMSKLYNVAFILEAPSTHRAISASQHIRDDALILSFSDIENWNQYDMIASNLPEIDEWVDDFNYLFDRFKSKNLNNESKSFSFQRNKQNIDAKINLSHGLNILFGEKGSGKTEVLKDFYNAHSHMFKFIESGGYASNNVKNLGDLYTQYLKDGLISKEISKKIYGIMNEKYSVSGWKVPSSNWQASSIYDNIASMKNESAVRRFLKSISYLNNQPINKTSIIKSEQEKSVSILEAISSILYDLKNSTVDRNLKSEHFNKIIDSHYLDIVSTYLFNHYNFDKRFHEVINQKYKVISKADFGVNKKIKTICSNLKSKNDLLMKLDSDLVKMLEIDFNLLSINISDESYGFNLNLVKRASKGGLGYDLPRISPSNDFKEIIGLMKSLSNEETISSLINIKTPNHMFEISFKDMFNIHIESKFSSDNRYIPSNGQYEMLKIDNALSNEDNLIIDELGNAIDNKYIFEKLLNKIINFRGMILASTHNPVIAVIPSIEHYYYIKKFKICNSKHSINGKFLIDDSEVPVISQLLDTIEGTDRSFILRDGKYHKE